MGTLNLLRFILLRDVSDKVHELTLLSSIILEHWEVCFSQVPNGQVFRNGLAEDCFSSNKEK